MKILFIIGTRPEAIKLCPLISECRKNDFVVEVCSTAQHRDLLDQALSLFSIIPNYDLSLMTPGQSLLKFSSRALSLFEDIFSHSNPDGVVVQGDTTSAFTAALAAYYSKIPVIHIEAGLRSGNIYSPFPEEGNRCMISNVASLHFAPTNDAAENLKRENFSKNVYVVGNTVIDSLLYIKNSISNELDNKFRKEFPFITSGLRTILVTAHRRESFGEPMRQICEALLEIVANNVNVQIIFPIHPNPNVQKIVRPLLERVDRVRLIPPLDYQRFIWMMSQSAIILTDSGGVQEEAPTFGVPVLIMRDVTEREEGIHAGVARLVGTKKEVIVENTLQLITGQDYYQTTASKENPYGDGRACERITKIMAEYFKMLNES